MRQIISPLLSYTESDYQHIYITTKYAAFINMCIIVLNYITCVYNSISQASTPPSPSPSPSSSAAVDHSRRRLPLGPVLTSANPLVPPR